MAVSEDESELPPGHLFFILDGKVHGNLEASHTCFADSNGKMLPKTKKLLYLQTTEASERETKV